MSHLLLLTLLSQAPQVEAELVLSEANPEETLTIDIPSGEVSILQLNVLDPDFPDEGELYINEQGPISLFPGGNSSLDSQIVNVNLELTTEQRDWFVPGQNALRFTRVATAGYTIYRVTALGDLALLSFDSVVPATDPVDLAMEKASLLYRRLAGLRTSVDNPTVRAMADYIAIDDWLGAAMVATEEPGFYNHVVRDFAAKMSNQDVSVGAPLTDFVATIVGITRDELDARDMLTGDFFYMATGDAVAVPSDLLLDVVTSNNHYAALEDERYDLAAVLTRVDQQYLRDPSAPDELASHPEPAGVLTTRGWMEAHATAGTNRRLAEFTISEFACAEMEQWADSTSPDAFVWRDVDRFPAGDAARYQTECKSCHANLDAFAGAYARFDFEDGFTKYAPFYPDGADDPDAMKQQPMGVSEKMTHNSDVFPDGYFLTDDHWTNLARSPANEARFGWRGDAAEGEGLASFAAAVADSVAFSRCMVERVFSEVCLRAPTAAERELVSGLACDFEASGYNLKQLFQTVATRPECLGAH